MTIPAPLLVRRPPRMDAMSPHRAVLCILAAHGPVLHLPRCPANPSLRSLRSQDRYRPFCSRPLGVIFSLFVLPQDQKTERGKSEEGQEEEEKKEKGGHRSPLC
jgi:hypothetical protein